MPRKRRPSSLSLAFGEQGRERAALDELHGEVGPLIGLEPEVVDRDDSGVLELGSDLRFLDEAL